MDSGRDKEIGAMNALNPPHIILLKQKSEQN
jgi:hypothetical protein